MPDDSAIASLESEVWPPTERLKEFVRAHIRDTKHPESLPFQAKDRPAETLEWEPVRNFDVTPPKDRARDLVPCRICQVEHKEYIGSVFAFSDAHLRLVGWKCAGNLFGMDYVKERRRAFNKEEARRDLIERVTVVRARIPEASSEAIRFSQSSGLSAVVRFREAWHSRMRDLNNMLWVMHLDHNGQLVVPERRSSAFREAGGREGGLGEYEWVAVGGALRGREGIAWARRPGVEARDNAKVLSEINLTLKHRSDDSLKDAEIKALIGDLEAAGRRLQEARSVAIAIIELAD